MNHMKCQSENHNEKEINTICLDKKCKDKRFCCLICLKDLHITHSSKWVEINSVNAFIEQEKNKQIKYPESCTYGQKQIIHGLEQLSNLVDSIQKIIKEKIQIIKQQNLQEYLKNNCKGQQGIEQWNNLLEGILQFVKIDNCLIKLATSDEGQLNEMDEQEIKIIKQQEKSLQTIINQFNSVKLQIYIPLQTKLYFDQNRKNNDFVIDDECTIRKVQNLGSSAIAYAKQGFDPSTQSYAFSFYIKEMGSYGAIGVGNDEKTKVKSYIFNDWHSVGHGQYMLCQHGSIFHHTDEKFNNKEKGMKFESGDKIQIRYDHLTKILEFRQTSVGLILKNAAVKIPITDMTKVLYPCVSLYYVGDQVQLAEY